MATRRNPLVAGKFARPTAAAAIAATLPLALAMAAGTAFAQQADPAPVAAAEPGALQQARKLLEENQPVAAKALLERMLKDDQVYIGNQYELTPSPSRVEAVRLMGEAVRKIATMNPIEASLQKARVLLNDGDVRSAERQAKSVQKNATATPDQADSAATLLKDIEQRRRGLEPIIPEALAQAERDFQAGRYAQAKAGLTMVHRSGVALSPEQQSNLDRLQLQLVDLGSTRPELFVSAADMGLLQPGVVRRRDNEPAPAQPAGQPAAQPTNPPVANPPAAQPAEPPPPQPNVNEVMFQAMQTEANSLLAQADKSYDDRHLNEAINRYNRLKAEFRDYLTPAQIQHIENRLAEAQVIRGGAGQPQGQQLNIDVIRRDQARAMFTNDMDEAAKALAGGNPQRARDLVAKAQFTINSNRDVFPEAEFENLSNQVATRRAEIERREQEIMAAEQAKREAELQRTTKETIEIQNRERERKIVELIDRARAYQSELRYAEALQAVQQLLFLDPINPTGLLLKDVYRDIMIFKKASDTNTLKQYGFATLSLDNQAASIPEPDLVNYPSDWPAISQRRGEPAQFAESAESRALMAKLNTQRIPTVAFNDNSLQDVITFIQSVSQTNVDVDWASLDLANIQRETPVSLSLNNVTVKSLLDRVVEKVSGPDRSTRADWAINDGVLTIASEDKIRKNVALHIYDIRDLLIEVPDYTDVPQIDLQQALQASQSGGGGGGGSSQGPFRNDQGNQDRQQAQRDRDERMNDLITIITSNIDLEGWQENGGDTGRIQKYAQGSLIITNTAKNHRQIAGLLSKLREIRAMQINVETRFLLVNQDFFEQIGFNLDIYLNANNNQVRAARGLDATIQPSDFFTGGVLNRQVAGAQRRWPGVVTPPNPTNTDPDTGTSVITQGVVNPRGWSPIGIQQDSLGLASSIAPSTDWSDTILSAAPALGIAGQFLDDIQVDFLVKATQADRRSIQLTAPRLTFTNGQTANIYVATQTAFVSDLTPVVGDSSVGFDPTVSVVTEGVTLLVEGTVTADRRYVTMNVDAGVARVDGFAQQAVSAVAGGQLVNSADVQSFIQLPKVTVTRVRTTVTVPDQGTILLGGQRLITEYEVESGVPVLSKIPIINRFFTNRIESREEQTLLILIKPTILIQNEEEERNYPGLLNSIRAGLGS